jgi:hypothetical protein
MSTQIKIPLHQLNLEMVHDLQEKYPNAEVVVDLQPERHPDAINEDDFWQLIDLIDWSKETDAEQVRPLIDALEKIPVKSIFAFDDKLAEKLYRLDQKVYAKEIGEDRWTGNSYFSVDTFLYVRVGVIANGQSFYDKVLKDATLMPKDLTYEPLLYVATIAYEKKTGKKYEYIPAYPVETYTNQKGWEK